MFPLVWEAFEDYRLGALQLTRLDVEMVRQLQDFKPGGKDEFDSLCKEQFFAANGWDKAKCRERDECKAKLERLGIL